MESFLLPIIKEFAPDLMIISAGFDSALGDEVGGLGVTPVGYSYMTQQLRKVQKRTLVALEGGYDCEALEKCSEAVIKTLLLPIEMEREEEVKLLEESGAPEGTTFEQLMMESMINPREQFKKTTEALAKSLEKFWPLQCEGALRVKRRTNTL